jgi:flagellar basal-body rod modification protein FlgD
MMQALDPIGPSTQVGVQTTQTSAEQSARNAFGVGFEDLLRIILTQLTYQDPLKPIENYEFVSQLAQFSQIQQSETGNERLLGILQTQSTVQATSFLGRRVDIPSGNGVLTGRVVSVSFDNGTARLTIETSNPTTTIGNIAVSSVRRVAEEP